MQLEWPVPNCKWRDAQTHPLQGGRKLFQRHPRASCTQARRFEQTKQRTERETKEEATSFFFYQQPNKHTHRHKELGKHEAYQIISITPLAGRGSSERREGGGAGVGCALVFVLLSCVFRSFFQVRQKLRPGTEFLEDPSWTLRLLTKQGCTPFPGWTFGRIPETALEPQIRHPPRTVFLDPSKPVSADFFSFCSSCFSCVSVFTVVFVPPVFFFFFARVAHSQAVARRFGLEAMGSRCNMLMTIQALPASIRSTEHEEESIEKAIVRVWV